MLEEILGWFRIIFCTAVGIGAGAAAGPLVMIISGIVGFGIGGSMNDGSRPYEPPKRARSDRDYSAHEQGCPPPWWDQPDPRP